MSSAEDSPLTAAPSPGPPSPSTRTDSPMSPLRRMVMDGFQRSPREPPLTPRPGLPSRNLPTIDGLYSIKSEDAVSDPLEVDSQGSCHMSPWNIHEDDVQMTPRTDAVSTPRNGAILNSSFRDLWIEDEPLSRSSTSLEESMALGGSRLKVTVAVRVRPFSKRECASKQVPSLTAEGNQVSVTAEVSQNAPPTGKRFRFHHVLWPVDVPCAPTRPVATQKTVFEVLASPLLSELVHGYNGALLCYGQTGTGKTFTMNGTSADPGIIPRCANALFNQLQAQHHTSCLGVYHVRMSYMEIYKEGVYDLLATHAGSPRRSVSSFPAAQGDADAPLHRRFSTLSSSGDATSPCSSQSRSRGLRVHHHPVRGVYVEGLSQRIVRSGADLLGLWKRGDNLRAFAATNLNDRSSRSHTLMTIEVSQPGGKDAFSSKVSRLYLADLAGSERLQNGHLRDPVRFAEMTATNLSLSTLGRVIELLSDPAAYGSDPLPPYRDSALTSLLADAFGGNCKTTFIATVSPALCHLPETLATLRYASRVRRIVNRPVVNEYPNTALVLALHQEAQALCQQVQYITTAPSPATNTKSHDEDLGQLCCRLDFAELLSSSEGQQHHEQRMGNTRARLKALVEPKEGLERQLTRAQQEVQRSASEAAAWVLATREADMADLAAEQVRLRALLETRERQVEELRQGMSRDPSQITVESEDDRASTTWARSWLGLSSSLPATAEAATQTDQPDTTLACQPRCAVCCGGPGPSVPAVNQMTGRDLTAAGGLVLVEAQGKLNGEQTDTASLPWQLTASLSQLQESEGRWARERAELLERLAHTTVDSMPGSVCNSPKTAKYVGCTEQHAFKALSSQEESSNGGDGRTEGTPAMEEAAATWHGTAFVLSASPTPVPMPAVVEVGNMITMDTDRRLGENRSEAAGTGGADAGPPHGWQAHDQHHGARGLAAHAAQQWTAVTKAQPSGGGIPWQAEDEDNDVAHRIWQQRLLEMERRIDDMRASYQNRLQALEVLLEEERAEAWRKVHAVERRLEAAVGRHFDAVAEVEERAEQEMAKCRQRFWRLEQERQQQTTSHLNAERLPPLSARRLLPLSARQGSSPDGARLIIEASANPTVAIPTLPLQEVLPALQVSPARMRSPTPRPVCIVSERFESPPARTLEATLAQLDKDSARTCHSSDVGAADLEHARHILQHPGLTEDDEDAVDTRLMRAVVAEYSMLLQSAVQNRPEWKEFFDSVLLMIDTVSGKPHVSWLSWFTSGLSTAEQLASALRRQEALNVQATAWLAGLQAQQEVMRHTIAAQIRINTRLAKERTAFENEAVDLRGRLERACKVLKRLYEERDIQIALLACPG